MSENKISLDLDNNLIQDFSPEEESTIAGGRLGGRFNNGFGLGGRGGRFNNGFGGNGGGRGGDLAMKLRLLRLKSSLLGLQ